MLEPDWPTIHDVPPPSEVLIGNQRIVRGDRVRLNPGARGDVFDLALAGQTAVVDAIEQDLEGGIHIAVIVDEDPGHAIGRRRPGHRFFFAPHEIDLVRETAAVASPREQTILVAGIGNVFLGDDGFGVEVARRMASRPLPADVRVADYGIRAYDLAYAIVAGHDRVILVDACPRGGAPGTVYVIEPDLSTDGHAGHVAVDAHAMNPIAVLALARTLGADLRNITIVGCEPATLGPPEGHLGLSEPVEAAVDEAIRVIESLLRDEPEPNEETPP